MKGGKLVINKGNDLKCNLSGTCAEVSSEIKLNESDSDFVFTIESWGQLSPAEMFNQAIELFQNKIERLQKDLSP